MERLKLRLDNLNARGERNCARALKREEDGVNADVGEEALGGLEDLFE